MAVVIVPNSTINSDRSSPKASTKAIVGDGNWRYLLALSGAAWGYAIWSLGLRLGDRILLRRGPDLIAGLSNRAAV